jgi:hypothetical protein
LNIAGVDGVSTVDVAGGVKLKIDAALVADFRHAADDRLQDSRANRRGCGTDHAIAKGYSRVAGHAAVVQRQMTDLKQTLSKGVAAGDGARMRQGGKGYGVHAQRFGGLRHFHGRGVAPGV